MRSFSPRTGSATLVQKARKIARPWMKKLVLMDGVRTLSERDCKALEADIERLYDIAVFLYGQMSPRKLRKAPPPSGCTRPTSNAHKVMRELDILVDGYFDGALDSFDGAGIRLNRGAVFEIRNDIVKLFEGIFALGFERNRCCGV